MAASYPYIRVWGVMMGLFDWAIEDVVVRASKQGAPPNAIHQIISDSDGNVIMANARQQWATTEDILASGLRTRFLAECERQGVPSPWADQPF